MNHWFVFTHKLLPLTFVPTSISPLGKSLIFPHLQFLRMSNIVLAGKACLGWDYAAPTVSDEGEQFWNFHTDMEKHESHALWTVDGKTDKKFGLFRHIHRRLKKPGVEVIYRKLLGRIKIHHVFLPFSVLRKNNKIQILYSGKIAPPTFLSFKENVFPLYSIRKIKT